MSQPAQVHTRAHSSAEVQHLGSSTPDIHVLCWNLQGEGNGYFVDRVQRAIADELDVPIADFTLQQKHKLHRQ